MKDCKARSGADGNDRLLKQYGGHSTGVARYPYANGGAVTGKSAPAYAKGGSIEMEGGSAAPRLDRPGRMKTSKKEAKKGTNVNVVVMAGKPDGGQAAMAPPPPNAGPMPPPPMRAFGGKVVARKHGGAVKKAGGGEVADMDAPRGPEGSAPQMVAAPPKTSATPPPMPAMPAKPGMSAPPEVMPLGNGPMGMMRKYGGAAKKADGGAISDDMKKEAKRLREEAKSERGSAALNAGAGLLAATAPRSPRGGLIGAGIGAANALMAGKSLFTGANKDREADRIEKGMAEDGKEDRRAAGGAVKMKYGAGSGEGRLEQQENYSKKKV